MSDPRRVVVSSDLVEFFRNQVSEAKHDLRVDLSDLVEFYLVRLLCDFSHKSKNAPVPGSEPLALMYKRACEGNVAQRAETLKNLGDVALYISGFFADFVEKQLVDLDYYIAMGGSAYGSLSGIVAAQHNGETFAELYLQLSKKFTALVDVLNQISEKAQAKRDSDQELLKLYDRWARTGSDRIRKLLLEKGLLPYEGVSTEYIQ
jgi:hypothetical protein